MMYRTTSAFVRKLAKRTDYTVESEIKLVDGNRIDVLVINPDNDALVIELKYVHPQYVSSRTKCTYVYTLCQDCKDGFLSSEPSAKWYKHAREKHHVTETF